jgi:hypothetical protein
MSVVYQQGGDPINMYGIVTTNAGTTWKGIAPIHLRALPSAA